MLRGTKRRVERTAEESQTCPAFHGMDSQQRPAIHARGKHHRPNSSMDGLSHNNIYSHLLQSDVVTVRFSLLAESAKSTPECGVEKHSRLVAHWEIGLNVLPLAVPRYSPLFARKVHAHRNHPGVRRTSSCCRKQIFETYENRCWKPQRPFRRLPGSCNVDRNSITVWKGIGNNLKAFAVQANVVGRTVTEVFDPVAIISNRFIGRNSDLGVGHFNSFGFTTTKRRKLQNG